MRGYPMVCFDVVSAFLHAEEKADVFMWTPKDYFDLRPELSCKIWRLKRALYGRRTAGADFRDFYEDVLTKWTGMLRGTTDPCLYHDRARDLTVTHHIDDGRVTGPPKVLKEFIAYLKKHMLVKVSPLIWPGDGVEHLGRTKLRTKKRDGSRSWIPSLRLVCCR